MKKPKTNNRPKFENTRKLLRKQKRQQKKVHRQEHYLKIKNVPSETKYEPGKYVKRPGILDNNVKVKKKPNISKASVQDIISKERQKEMKEANKLKNQMEDQRKQLLLKANEDEDKVIKQLEKKLGLNKSKNKNNYFADDGLDYLLEVCDKSTTEQIVAAEKHLAEVEGDSDFEDDLAVVTGKEITDKKRKKIKEKNEKVDTDDDLSKEDDFDSDTNDNEMGDDFDDDLEEMDDDSEFNEDDDDSSDSEAPEEKPTKSSKNAAKTMKTENFDSKLVKVNNKKIETKTKVISEDELSKVFSDDEVSHLSDDDDDDDEFQDEDNDEENKKEKPDVWEDIYGRKRDKEGNIIKEEKGVYIPPHLRNKDSSSDKQLAQLKRQIKSVLNKLAGTNLHWASTTIENLYSNNSRNSVNSSLSELWLEAIVGPSSTPDRMVAEHVALVSVLHANVGSEIGAHFLQELSKRFDEMMERPQPIQDKKLDNLVSCLAQLYSFKIYQAALLYDILGRLVDELSEKNIECVLVALRNVGGVLRKEEPLALKNFIHDTQGKVAKIKEDAATGSRIKFLLEVLMAVKNNNLSKIPNYDPSYTEHLKKMTRGIVRRGNYVTPLNIRLEDLLKGISKPN